MPAMELATAEGLDPPDELPTSAATLAVNALLAAAPDVLPGEANIPRWRRPSVMAGRRGEVVAESTGTGVPVEVDELVEVGALVEVGELNPAAHPSLASPKPEPSPKRRRTKTAVRPARDQSPSSKRKPRRSG